MAFFPPSRKDRLFDFLTKAGSLFDFFREDGMITVTTKVMGKTDLSLYTKENALSLLFYKEANNFAFQNFVDTIKESFEKQHIKSSYLHIIEENLKNSKNFYVFFVAEANELDNSTLPVLSKIHPFVCSFTHVRNKCELLKILEEFSNYRIFAEGSIPEAKSQEFWSISVKNLKKFLLLKKDESLISELTLRKLVKEIKKEEKKSNKKKAKNN